MYTLKDLLRTIDTIMASIKFFGITRENKIALDEHIEMIKAIILEELGLNREEAMMLPPETPLGERSAAAYEELKKNFLYSKQKSVDEEVSDE